jgi:ABC-type transporter Mla MlaB component
MASKQVTRRKRGGNRPPEAVAAAAPDSAQLMLPADCRMATQMALKDELLGMLSAGAVVLDGSQVERVDTAALQLLLLFRREAVARDCTVSWHGASGALGEAAALLGLAQTLELPALALA